MRYIIPSSSFTNQGADRSAQLIKWLCQRAPTSGDATRDTVTRRARWRGIVKGGVTSSPAHFRQMIHSAIFILTIFHDFVKFVYYYEFIRMANYIRVSVCICVYAHTRQRGCAFNTNTFGEQLFNIM